MGTLGRGTLLQGFLNLAVVQFFLLLIVRRMPSLCKEFNHGNIFSHVNILVTYMAGLVLNPSVDLADGSISQESIMVVLLALQLLLMAYLLKISFGKLKEMIKEARAQVPPAEVRGLSHGAVEFLYGDWI